MGLFKTTLTVLLLVVGPYLSLAENNSLRLSPLFSDHMVLQRGRRIAFSGTATKGSGVEVLFANQSRTLTSDGNGRWTAEFDALAAGGPYSLSVTSGAHTIRLENIAIGDVWICAGQSNMKYPLKGQPYFSSFASKINKPDIRFFNMGYGVSRTPESGFKSGQTGWKVCTPEDAQNLSGVAYYFASEIQKKTNVPIGLIVTAKPGSFIEAWIPEEDIRSNPEISCISERWGWIETNLSTLKLQQKIKEDAWEKQYRERFKQWGFSSLSGPFKPKRPSSPPSPNGPLHPGNLYNAMVHPFTNFPVKAVLWYQGESNSDRAYQYRFLIRQLIRSWRNAWGNADMPFVVIQLPNYDYSLNPYDHQDGGPWEELRESQEHALNEKNTALAVTLGLGLGNDVHPPNKEKVGIRAAACALKLVCHDDSVQPYAPRYLRSEVNGNSIQVEFADVGTGLWTLDGNEAKGFVIAGENQQFYPAAAVIENRNVITISSPHVPRPVAVRYAWEGNPVCNVANSAGLPLSSFRTDSWTLKTQQRSQPYWWLTLDE